MDYGEDSSNSKLPGDIDYESLKSFKSTLICTLCSKFPKPESNIYICPKCCKVVCASCRSSKSHCNKCKESMKPVQLIHDTNLTKLAKGQCYLYIHIKSFAAFFESSTHQNNFHYILDSYLHIVFKNRQCANYDNGCMIELEIKDLPEHEKQCKYRSITCPSLICKKPNILYENLLDHYQQFHTNLEPKDDVLAFNGTIQSLRTSTYVMNCFDNQFFPQFYIGGNLLVSILYYLISTYCFSVKSTACLLLFLQHLWVVLLGSSEDAADFEIFLSFYINGECR